MSILVIAEHDNTELKTATLNTVAAGMAIGGDIDILVAGSDCDTVAESAAQVPGVGKVLLANKATSMLHGKRAAENSEQAAKEAFSGNSLGANLPSVKVKSKELNKQMSIMDLIILSKLEYSKSEIRRLIKGNAIKINDNIVSDEKFEIAKNLFKENYLKLSLGKKRHIKIELN